MADSQSRKWLLTINNPQEKELTHEKIKQLLMSIKDIGYYCMADEIGENKTYHTHVFVYRKNPIRFSKIKNTFGSAHIDKAYGTAKENRAYIRKEGKYKGTEKETTNLKDTFEESGAIPDEHQGQRNDLHNLYDWIKEGKTNYEILEENPDYMLNLEKIEMCRQIVKQEQFKNVFRTLQVEYHYGKSGSGKTKSIMEKYGYENVYRITDIKNPWDSYKGQDIVVFEEFVSGYWKITDMLNYLDGYPLELPCRYANKQACFTKVYLTSNMEFEQQYKDIKREYPETWEAWCRRIHCIKVFDSENHITEYTDIKEYLRRWKEAKDNPFRRK